MDNINLPNLGEPERNALKFGRSGPYGTVSLPIGDTTYTAGIGMPQSLNGRFAPMFGVTQEIEDGSVGVKIDPRLIQLLLKHRF